MRVSRHIIGKLAALSVMFIATCYVQAYARQVVVSAEIEKRVYGRDEPVEVKLFVENKTGSSIISDAVSVSGGDVNSPTGNLFFTLYKLQGSDASSQMNPARYVAAARGFLRPVLVLTGPGTVQQLAIPVHSTALVADGEVFQRLRTKREFFKAGW